MVAVDGYGLAGLGRREHLSIEILESTDPGPRCELSIETPHATLRFAVPGTQTLRSALTFLDEARTEWGELEVGELSGSPVLLVRDHPPTNRYFLKAMHSNGLAELTFADAAALEFREALRDAIQDLED